MENDKTLRKLLDDYKVRKFTDYMKTSNWKKLKPNQRKNFFLRFNRLLAQVLDINEIDLSVRDKEINSDNFMEEERYYNVVLGGEDCLVINDVDYNQYLTLYEYLYRVRLHLLELSFLDYYDADFDEEKETEIAKNYRLAEFGDVYVSIMKEDGHPYEDFQYINIEAREFARTFLFEIIKSNYNECDSYDEELFLSNYEILDNQLVIDAGKGYYDSYLNDAVYRFTKLEEMKKKVERLGKGNLKELKDEDLMFMVYPSVIKNSPKNAVVNAFNEIVRRTYGYDLNIRVNKKELMVGNNSYPLKSINNLLNIVIFECLNDMNMKLSMGGLNKENILESKKKWLFSLIVNLDKSIDEEDFGALKFQSVYRLLNKEKIKEFLEKTDGNYFPLKRGVN